MTAEEGTTGGKRAAAAKRWLQAELGRVWLLSELCLRHYQRSLLRPAHDHPATAELEAVLTVRRDARGGGSTGPQDVDELQAALAELEASLPRLRERAPLGQLVTALGLRPMELEALLITIAPHIDAPLSEMFSLLRGSGHRRGVDLALVAQLLRLPRDERILLLDAIDPDRPLLSWRLVQAMPIETPEGYGSVYYRALQPTLDLLSVLFGRTELSPNLAHCAELTSGDGGRDELLMDRTLRAQVDALCGAFATARGGEGAGRPPWVLLWGPRGAGKRTIARRLAAAYEQPLLQLNPTVVEPSAIDELLRRAQREALLRGAVLYIGPLLDPLTADQGRALLRRFDSFPATVILGVETMQPPRLKIHRALQEVEVSLPSEAVRQALWERQIPAGMRSSDLKLRSLARAFKLTPGEIVETAAEGLALARLRPDGRLLHSDLRTGVVRRLRNELADVARQIHVTAKWSDLILPPEDMFRVREFIHRSVYARQVYSDWGMEERVGYGRGMIALFSGPPGTGKTMLAGLIARELDLDIYQVDLAQVVSKWVGETEKQLAKVFDQAERAHALLLFDEADSLFAKRTEVKGSNDRYGNLAVNYLLQRLEQYSGVAVLTTNKEAALDEALQRRLTLHLHLDVPEVPERERLWRSFLPAKLRRARDIDFLALAREYELSGGYIKNVALRAAFLAAAAGSSVTMALLRRAAALELEDQGKLVSHGAWRMALTQDPHPPSSGDDPGDGNGDDSASE